MLDKNFKDIISNIKEEIINTQIKTMQEVNSNLIMLYFKLGKIVSENKQYGNNFTKQVSIELKLTFPNMKGFSERNIRSMRLFYEEYADDEKWQQLVAKLPWGHNLLLIEKIKDKDIIKIYAENTIKNGWSRNVLAIQIETEFHKRIGNSNNNFNAMLPPKDSDLVNNTIKDPYIFDFITFGLLLCRGKNRLTVDWSLKSTNVPIGVSTYELKEQLPKELIDKLPTEEEINQYLDIDETNEY